MPRYAENTKVSTDKSRTEIERTLQRYGASGFMYGWEEDKAIIAFRMNDRHIRFTLQMPNKAGRDITHTPTGQVRSQSARDAFYEQVTRQRWRALALCIKAKLEAVEAEITTFEEEFLAHIILPNNRTVSEWVSPQIKQVYLTGNMPKLLPGIGETDE